LDDLRTVAELAGIDARHARARKLVLIAAPADSAIVQNDCDCACPVVPASAVPARPLREHMRLRLHPQAHFVELYGGGLGTPPKGHPAAPDPHLPEMYLLFIPSVLSGVVVSRDLRDGLLAIGAPMPIADLRDGMPQELIERCFRLGILVDDRSPEPPPDSDVLVAWLHVPNA
jgi:hypothetical protein